MTIEPTVQVQLTALEAEVLALFRQQFAMLRRTPDGWVFKIDCNPDRLVGEFTGKEWSKLQRQKPVMVNGNGVRHG